MQSVRCKMTTATITFTGDPAYGGGSITRSYELPIIQGTNGNESLTGTGNSDRILGLDGNDIIAGGNGNDILYGSNSQSGGNDYDILTGNTGVDYYGVGWSGGNYYNEPGKTYALITEYNGAGETIIINRDSGIDVISKAISGIGDTRKDLLILDGGNRVQAILQDRGNLETAFDTDITDSNKGINDIGEFFFV